MTASRNAPALSAPAERSPCGICKLMHPGFHDPTELSEIEERLTQAYDDVSLPRLTDYGTSGGLVQNVG
jgi:hypothetical protein